MLERDELTELIKDQLLPDWRAERERLDRIDRWYRWSPEDPKLPHGATPELKALLELSRVPWLGLVVTSTAQCLSVDGYRSSLDDPEPSSEVPDVPVGPWRYWLANQLDRRQAAIHRAALAYGYAYATVLPGEDFRGQPMPVIRGVSPRKMWAAYEDPAEDDWPVYVLRMISKSENDLRAKLYDDEFEYTVRTSEVREAGEPWLTIEGQPRSHDAGVPPVVRYCNELDLDGRTPGEVEPHIPLAARINKTSYDRMLVQHFNSWKVRTIAGMEEPDDQEAARRKKLVMRQGDLLIANDPNTKFGTLDETPLNGFIDANGADIEHLAAVTQTPAHELTGSMVNLSAEALAAARASQTQKVDERKRSFGAGHAQTLRLAAHLDKDHEHADDITGRVTWQDTSIRSMAQAVDALGKAATMLNVPASELWGRIPGVEKSDVEQWKKVAELDDPINRMQDQLNRQAAPADDLPIGA